MTLLPNIISFIILAAYCAFSAASAAALDLTYHPPRTTAMPVSITVTLPTLRCGMQGRPSNECIPGGNVQARGPAEMNIPLRYVCTVHYSYAANDKAGFKVSFSREEKTVAAGIPLIPGVGPAERDKPLTNVPEYGKAPSQSETVRFKGIAYHHGTLQIKDGKGEQELAESGPLLLKEQVGMVMLDTVECRQE